MSTARHLVKINLLQRKEAGSVILPHFSVSASQTVLWRGTRLALCSRCYHPISAYVRIYGVGVAVDLFTRFHRDIICRFAFPKALFKDQQKVLTFPDFTAEFVSSHQSNTLSSLIYVVTISCLLETVR